MTKFLQIVLIVAVLCYEANGTPLFQGISFQRGFEINFKPIQRKPITFLKEKWSPFGVFGRKHSIQKRNLNNMMVVSEAPPVVPLASGVPEPRPAAPVFEHVEEEHLHTAPILVPLYPTPRPIVPMLISSPIPPPVTPIPPQVNSPVPIIVSSPAPPVVSLPPVPQPTVVNIPPLSMPPGLIMITPKEPTKTEESTPAPPIPIMGSLPPLSTNMVVPPPSNRYTDISQVEPVRETMDFNQPIPPPLAAEEKVVPSLETNSIKPEPPRDDIVINENSLIRGSKLALYFGSIFLQLMSQFMTNARATFDQMTNPPPIFRN